MFGVSVWHFVFSLFVLQVYRQMFPPLFVEGVPADQGDQEMGMKGLKSKELLQVLCLVYCP